MLKAVWIVHMIRLVEPARSRARSLLGRFALLRSEQSNLARAHARGLPDASGLCFWVLRGVCEGQAPDSPPMGIEPVRSTKQRSLCATRLKLRRELMPSGGAASACACLAESLGPAGAG
jgi:hypothetical protein